LKELESNRLTFIRSPHAISAGGDQKISDRFFRDLTAITDFLFYIESEPFITPEKAKNHKRVAFKKGKAA